MFVGVGVVIDDALVDSFSGDTADVLEILGCGAEKFWPLHVGAVGGLVGCIGSALRLERFGGLLVWGERGGWG